MALVHHGKGWALRPATPEDNPRLCELVRTIHMKSKIDVTQERDPDFFALGRMHLGPVESWVFTGDDGGVEGCVSLCVREALMRGERARTGYFCDLRLTPKLRGGGVIAEASRAVMDYAKDAHGADLFYDVIFDTNKVARGALEARSEKRRSVPVHAPMTPFHMTSVQLTTAKAAPSRAISRARAEDNDELAAFLQHDHARRALGYVVNLELLEERFRTWPGFAIESFFLSRDARGKINGCLAPWDTSSFKRTRVLGYHGEMRLVRAAFDLAARVRRYRTLPRPGECFEFSYLTHLAVKDDEPAILRELLRAAYAELLPTRQHFLAAMIPRGSSLEAAFSEFTVNRTKMTLYAVHDEKSRWNGQDLTTLHPGFEMALS